MKTIFLTGSTGFLGSYLAYECLKQGYSLKLLIRDKKESALERFRKSLEYLSADSGEFDILASRVEIIPGDITLCNFGIASGHLKKLCSEIDIVFHNAALTNFRAPHDDLERQNVEGTKHALAFALQTDGAELHYVGTAYICGTNKGRFAEEDLDTGQGFNNHYERSKFHAEQSIKEYSQCHGIKTTIYRPSIIVGDSKNGRASSFMGLYSFIKAVYLLVEIFTRDIEKGGGRAALAGVSYKGHTLDIPLRIAANVHKTLNIVPIDYVVDVIMEVLRAGKSSGMVYHIINPNPPTIFEINEALKSVFNISGIQIVYPEDFDRDPMTEWEEFFGGTIEEVTPYLMKSEPVFDDTNTQAVLSGTHIKRPLITHEFIEKLVSYYRNNSGFKK